MEYIKQPILQHPIPTPSCDIVHPSPSLTPTLQLILHPPTFYETMRERGRDEINHNLSLTHPFMNPFHSPHLLAPTARATARDFDLHPFN